jgi:hypothetical protein
MWGSGFIDPRVLDLGTSCDRSDIENKTHTNSFTMETSLVWSINQLEEWPDSSIISFAGEISIYLLGYMEKDQYS